MGTVFAPSYTNLTMGFFELTFYDLCREKFREDLLFYLWKLEPFFDDCEILLEENKINLNDLISILNSINPTIQFKMEYSKWRIGNFFPGHFN